MILEQQEFDTDPPISTSSPGPLSVVRDFLLVFQCFYAFFYEMQKQENGIKTVPKTVRILLRSGFR